MKHSSESWYIIQAASEQCEILCQSPGESPDEDSLEDSLQQSPEDKALLDNTLNENALKRWGPFSTKSQAIAKRVGLIRAGKCKPS